MVDAENVCLRCGACCSSLRVSFHRREIADYDVPEAIVIAVEPANHVALRGTLGEPRRCVGLVGRVGEAASCTVYARRPGVCRDFAPSREGDVNPHCDDARAKWGLPHLR